MKCTAAQAVSTYSNTRDKSAFTKNKGSSNYTYAGYVCGLNGPAAAWCAMQVSLSIYEACGNDMATAKQVMYGVWPYSATSYKMPRRAIVRGVVVRGLPSRVTSSSSRTMAALAPIPGWWRRWW